MLNTKLWTLTLSCWMGISFTLCVLEVSLCRIFQFRIGL